MRPIGSVDLCVVTCLCNIALIPIRVLYRPILSTEAEVCILKNFTPIQMFIPCGSI